MCSGVLLPQWWLLHVALLADLSNLDSLLGMKGFAKRHRKPQPAAWHKYH